MSVVEGELEDDARVAEALSGVNDVFHLGAALTNRGASARRIVDSIVLGTFNVLEGLRSSGDRCRLVHVSSTSVYYSGPRSPYGNALCDEVTPIAPSTPYGAAKWAAELLVEHAVSSGWCTAVIVRPSDTADGAELLDPTSVFGRRWFVASALANYQSSERDTTDRVSTNVYRHLLKLPEDSLFYVTDLKGREPLVQVGEARSMAKFLVDSLESVKCGVPLRLIAAPAEIWPLGEFVRSIAKLMEPRPQVSPVRDDIDAGSNWLFGSSRTSRRVADAIRLLSSRSRVVHQ